MCAETYGFAEELEVEARKARAMLEASGQIPLTDAQRSTRRVSRRSPEGKRARTEALRAQLDSELLQRWDVLLRAWPRDWEAAKYADRLAKEALRFRRKREEPAVLTDAERAWIAKLVGVHPVMPGQKRKKKSKRRPPRKPTWSTKKARRAMNREARIRGVEV
jgi:hypothetical protein